jgi:predicted metal-dependent hydrolase
MNAQVHAPMHVRQDLDFGIDQDMPRHWFGNDPFKTRVFDAMTLIFPEGEKYFIQSVRLFRDQITDPAMQAKVRDFIRQEAQHGIAHERFNQVMIQQGMPVKQMIGFMTRRFDDHIKNQSPEFNLALTTASEHITALMAECFFASQHTMQAADPRARALLAWHAIEEMEHRAVAFDVLTDVAHVRYPLRAAALVMVGMMMPTFALVRVNQMLKVDGYSRLERLNMFRQGMPWLFGRTGILASMKKPFLDWFRRDFHPDDHAMIAQYPVWLQVFEQTQDPLQAGEAFWAAGRK